MKIERYYTNERNAQIVVALLKARGIRKVIASPGSTNISFVGSVQNDPFFEVYSWVDERSAAYAACGMAAECGEPVVLSCTGATASRNYLPGLTEAFYRKLPVIAITSGHEQSCVGNLIGQVIDRNVTANDVCVKSVLVRTVKDEKDEWDCQIKVNRALNALTEKGGGPVHLNLETANIRQPFSVKEITGVKNITRHTIYDQLPEIPQGRIGIWVGAHNKWSEDLIFAVEAFCETNNAVVFCDHTSNYCGKYKILAPLLGSQDNYAPEAADLNLLIHIGETTGSYEALSVVRPARNVWRVSEDGEIKDVTKKLNRVFEMPEIVFFKEYSKRAGKTDITYYQTCKEELIKIQSKISELPLSNLWVAKTLSSLMPDNVEIHFAILNSLRSWNFFELPDSIRCYSNVGGFGIDGNMSSMIGASLCNPDKIYFCMTGDLAFLYDMNVLANRHVGNNIRVLLINNGKGVEFRNYNHQAALWGERADEFIAAARHLGNKSPLLVRHYAEDLGFEYMSASSKEDVLSCTSRFLTPGVTEKPMLFEIFTKTEDEKQALFEVRNMFASTQSVIKNVAKTTITTIAGENVFEAIKNYIKK